MGIELGRVGSADMAKSTVMMQLLAAHHEALGQRDAVSARHEELERRHYELMKAQARLEVEREGGGSPRRNRGGEREELETGGQGGSGSDTVLHKIETMVEGLHKKIEEHGKILTRTGKGSGEEKQTNDLEAMAKHEDR